MLETGLASLGAAGRFAGRAFQHRSSERAGDPRGRVAAVVGDDQHEVPRTAVGSDGFQAAADDRFLVVSRDQDQEADSAAVPRSTLAIEERSQGQGPQVQGDSKAGQAHHGSGKEQRGAHTETNDWSRGGLVR